MHTTSYPPLYDSSGNKVITGTEYYLVPAFTGHGGGLYHWVSKCYSILPTTTMK